ncbi:MAG: hypothetical protein AAF914_03545 [Pseudomonadota bacterium]
MTETLSRIREDAFALGYLYGKAWVLLRLNAGRLFLAFVIGAGLVALSAALQPPSYTARALVGVENTVVDEAVLQLRPGAVNVPAILTRVQAISSPAVIRRAIEDGGLAELSGLRDPGAGFAERFGFAFLGHDAEAAHAARLAAAEAALAEAAVALGQPIERVRSEDLVDRIADGLRVSPIGTSNMIEVSFTATDPDTAARVANAVVAAYFALEAERSSHQLAEGVALYETRSQALRATLETLRQELQDRRRDRALSGASPEGLRSVIGELTAEVGRVESMIRAEEERLEALTSATGLVAVALALDALDAEHLRPLVDAAISRDQRDRLAGRPAAPGMTPEHAVLDAAVAEFIAAKREIIETQRLHLARIVATLNDRLAELATIEATMAEDAGIEADIRVTSSLLENAQARADALYATSSLLGSRGIAMSDALPPLRPDGSSLAIFAVTAALAGIAAAGAVLILTLAMDGNYRFSAALEADTHLPALTSLPRRLRRHHTGFERKVYGLLRQLGLDHAVERPFCLMICSLGQVRARDMDRLSAAIARPKRRNRLLAVRCMERAGAHEDVSDILHPDQSEIVLPIIPGDAADFHEKARRIVHAASNTHDAVVFVLEHPDLVPPDGAARGLCDAFVFIAQWGRTRRRDVRALCEFTRAPADAAANANRSPSLALLVSVPDFVRDFEVRYRAARAVA